jgi:hypothetical protein
MDPQIRISTESSLSQIIKELEEEKNYETIWYIQKRYYQSNVYSMKRVESLELSKQKYIFLMATRHMYIKHMLQPATPKSQLGTSPLDNVESVKFSTTDTKSIDSVTSPFQMFWNSACYDFAAYTFNDLENIDFVKYFAFTYNVKIIVREDGQNYIHNMNADREENLLVLKNTLILLISNPLDDESLNETSNSCNLTLSPENAHIFQDMRKIESNVEKFYIKYLQQSKDSTEEQAKTKDELTKLREENHKLKQVNQSLEAEVSKLATFSIGLENKIKGSEKTEILSILKTKIIGQKKAEPSHKA